jgi:hypothetical protein
MKAGMRPALAAMMLLAVLPGCFPGSSGAAQSPGVAYIRANQVGYAISAPKQAILMATGPETGGTFSVVDASTGKTVYTGAITAGAGSWSKRFAHTYTLDFSPVRRPARYYIRVDGPVGAQSPTFRIATGAHLYARLLVNARFYYLAQHDGSAVDPRVLSRRPSHLADLRASLYDAPVYKNGALQGQLHRIGGPIDVSGGWFDAGDYLKFVATASYVDTIMLLAARTYPAILQHNSADFAAEGRFGLDWLQKMWDSQSETLYYQVGLGDGNGTSILGDHDFWRLPEADDRRRAGPGDPAYYVRYRPVFRAGPPGSRISPNLAGRMAAALALCFQLYHGSDPPYARRCLRSAEQIFDLAQTSHVGQLLTATQYDFYPETEWHDDMELGAAELYLAVALGGLPSGLPHADPRYYLSQAARWARAYVRGPNDGSDSLNFYDVSGLAHYELYRALAQAGNPGGLDVAGQDLRRDVRDQLLKGVRQAAKDPFGLGIAYGNGQDAAPHALGLALEAEMYDDMAGVKSYERFAQTELDWALGENAWGTSFIVGAGSVFPHCMQHQIANLSGSLDGTPPILLGATVDGPNATSVFKGLGTQNGMRRCPVKGGDPFAAFSARGARYLDNAIAWPSVEPADDYVALGILLFARETGR